MNEPPKFAKYRRRRRWPLLLLLPVLLLLGGGAYAYLNAQSILDAFKEGEKGRLVESANKELGAEPKNELPGLRPGTTFLLVGSDTRAYEGNVWGRSDTILVAKIFPKDKAISVLSLPRDLLVNIPGYGEDKINHAYSFGGPRLLIKTVREFIGVRIDHYFQIGFQGFAKLVGDFDGVYLPIDQRYLNKNDGGNDDYAEINLRPGYQKLMAYDALSWVRFRHLDDDFYRAARQQIFLREVSRQLNQRAGGDLGQLRNLAQSIARAGASDFSSLTEAARLANTLRTIPPSRVVRVTMEGQDVMINGGYYLSVDEATKASVLKLWNNPRLALRGQKQRRGEATMIGSTVLDIMKALGEPLASLKPLGPLGGWNGAYDLEAGGVANVEEAFLRAQARELQAGGKKKKAKKNSQEKAKAPRPNRFLVSNPAPPLRSQALNVCRPLRLPSGYYWPEGSSHRYQLAGKPALAQYATAGSGNSILWMWSTWKEAPILSDPDDGVLIKGKVYDVWWESGKIRMVAWRRGETVVWVTNTLKNSLDSDEMLSLALSCR